ncbi:hypothetical protein [Serratia fonticola]|uniref:hypothetical protein n=1 Tax=Serratia fonticola TaxID=47917 RepID=UPI001376AB6C|nr:hypothetical protein [Serratia fonticola]NCG51962.1 hypothetical protein [Serratia fonticola]
MKRKLWPIQLMAGTLLLMSTSVSAVQYSPNFYNCDIVNIGQNKWQAKFTMAMSVCSGCADTTDNTFYAWLPKLNTATGKPTNHNYGNRASPAGFSVLTHPDGRINPVINISSVSFYSPSSTSPRVITQGADYIVEFTTDGNNAYPALYISYSNLTTGGGTSNIPLMVLPKVSNCYALTTPPENLPPIDELVPTEPKFELKQAMWELNALDVGDLPNVATPGNGYAATIKNVGSNNLCLSYVTKGVKNKAYSLGVTNRGGNFSGRNLLVMNGAEGSQLPYSLQLNSNDGVTGNNYSFPSSGVKYITLKQDTSAERSEMCWTPAVNIFKTNTTQEGMHTDTVNFIITPNA